MKISYQDSGVNISEGNRAVELMKERVKATYIPGVVGEIGLFAGGFSMKEFKHYDDPTLLASTDGVGTKVMIAQQLDKHDTIGIDLVAMCVNDLICQGAKPLFFLDYIATGKVDAEKIANLVGSIAAGCKESGCALIGGETAEMPGLYGENEYDLAGFSVGVVDREKIIDGCGVQAGDSIIGLASSGLHSNGYSLARKIFFDHLGLKVNDTYKTMSDTIGNILLTPTKLYVKTVLSLLDMFNIKGIANITGGGLLENVPRILPKGLDAIVDCKAWTLPEIFQTIVDLDVVENNELYRSLNMGIGMVIIAPHSQASHIVEFINSSTSDKAYIIGHIAEGNQSTQLTNL